MRQISITTDSGMATYPLATGAPAPTIKCGALVFHTTSGVQSVPAGTVLDFVVSTAKRQTKEEKLAEALKWLGIEIRAARRNAFDIARNLDAENRDGDDPAFCGELEIYSSAVTRYAALKAKADRFRERRAETLAKKAAAPAATPAPKKPAKKSAKK